MRETRFLEAQERAAAMQAPSPPKPTANGVANRFATNATNTVTNKRRPATLTDKTRVALWRAANPERYRDYMRGLMRKLRAASKEAVA
jgi:hypothetical protein